MVMEMYRHKVKEEIGLGVRKLEKFLRAFGTENKSLGFLIDQEKANNEIMHIGNYPGYHITIQNALLNAEREKAAVIMELQRHSRIH